MLGTYPGRALRWAIFLKPLKPHPSMRNLLSATVVGFTAITLFGRPGEFVRPYLIARKEQVPVTSQFAAWVLERIFDLLMALLLFAFALTRVQSSDLHVGEKLTWVLAAGGKVGGALGAIDSTGAALPAPLRRAAAPAPDRRLAPPAGKRSAGLERTLNALFQGVESMRSDAALFLVLFYSALEWVLICLCYWCLARSFAGIVNLGLVDVLILMGFVSFGSIVQIPGVGGGMQVVSVLVLTELFGVRLEIGYGLRRLSLGYYICSNCSAGPVRCPQRGPGLAQPEADWPGGIRMKCPFCNHLHDKVVDSRESKEGDAIRRRRECLECNRRYTTYERIDEVPYMVIKKDGRREKFDRQKVLGRSPQGLRKASRQHGTALRTGQPGGIQGQRLTGPRDIYYRHRRISDGEPPGTGQDRLCTLRVGLPGFPGRGGILQRAQATDAAENALAGLARMARLGTRKIPCNLNDFKTSLKIGL